MEETSDTGSSGATELEATSGSGEEVGCATSEVGASSMVLVAAISETTDETSGRGAISVEETTSEEATGIEVKAISEALSEATGATTISDVDAPAAISVAAAEETAGSEVDSVPTLTTALAAGTERSANLSKDQAEGLTFGRRDHRLNDGSRGRFGSRLGIGTYCVLVSTDLTCRT